MSVFFNSNGFLSFIYLGPAYKQKYKYVPRIVNSGPGVPDSSHGFVRRSVKMWYNNNETQYIHEINSKSYANLLIWYIIGNGRINVVQFNSCITLVDDHHNDDDDWEKKQKPICLNSLITNLKFHCYIIAMTPQFARCSLQLYTLINDFLFRPSSDSFTTPKLLLRFFSFHLLINNTKKRNSFKMHTHTHTELFFV